PGRARLAARKPTREYCRRGLCGNRQGEAGKCPAIRRKAGQTPLNPTLVELARRSGAPRLRSSAFLLHRGSPMHSDRIRLPALLDRVMSAAEAASLIEDGMTVGMSGFTRAGEAKAVPLALAERARRSPLQISLMTGASLGNDLDKQLTEAGVLARRMPFQVDSTLRKAINDGSVMFIDQHLSETVEQLRNHQLKKPDIAVIEAVAITEQGHIVPTTSVGNSASFAIFA